MTYKEDITSNIAVPRLLAEEGQGCCGRRRPFRPRLWQLPLGEAGGSQTQAMN